MKIEEIKKQLKSGDIAGAAEAAEELLKGDPDNVRAMMLFGTCRQLQGDEATFRDTYRVVKEHLEAQPDALDAETKAAWQRFGELYAKLGQPEDHWSVKAPHRPVLMEYVVLAVLVASAVVTGIWCFGAEIKEIFGWTANDIIEDIDKSRVDCVRCAADIDHNEINSKSYDSPGAL